MYKYEYVTLSAEDGRIEAKLKGIQSVDSYREIIDARAAEGWRYVGYIPTRESIRGYTKTLELIFEKEI